MTERKLGNWTLRYCGWDRAAQPLREALTTLGNGHFASRGAAEEGDWVSPHYPGTYLGGGYDRAESEVAGRIVENEDLVNWPNWLPLTFRCEDGHWFNLDSVYLFDYEQTLDLYHGTLNRRIHFEDRDGRKFELESRRFVHMADAHVAAIEWTLTPLNWSGRIEILTAIDGAVENAGVARYRALEGKHLETVACGATGEDAIFLTTRTRQSHIVMTQAVRTRVNVDDTAVAIERNTERARDWIGQHLLLSCEAKKPVRVEKVLALFSSRDHAISEPGVNACKHIHRIANIAELRKRHGRAWEKLWRHADISLSGQDDDYAQSVLRLHIFHLLQTASMNTIGRDVSIPARGLHGEAYRGHIFWDELFTFPFLNLRIPELTRSLLLYRYRRLDEARFAAKEAGFTGAMFPWQSGSDGREESQVIHLNPKSGRWTPDNSYRQRHVNSAIAYNIWQYYEATGDLEFLSFYGAEMLLEIARFWASIATYNPARQRYEIHGVVGPDEFHTGYPHTDTPGLNNNAYTNVMAAWVMHTAALALDLLAGERGEELLATLEISGDELHLWDEISRSLYVPFNDDGIISQFEGWENLEQIDWDGLRRRHGDIRRLDRVLKAEQDDPNRYQATKQADVLMLFYLFSSEELVETFGRLGYSFDPAWIPKNVEYYLARTSHGSTLSHVVHAWVMARADRRGSWHLFQEALASDIDDVQGGTTPEGIHIGAMAGTVDLVQRCYTGIEVRRDVLWLNPRLPDGLENLELSIKYRRQWLSISVNHELLNVEFKRGCCAPVKIGFNGKIHPMDQGEFLSFSLAEAPT